MKTYFRIYLLVTLYDYGQNTANYDKFLALRQNCLHIEKLKYSFLWKCEAPNFSNVYILLT